MTRRVLNKESFQMYLLTGVSVGDAVIKDEYQGNTNYPVYKSPGLEEGSAITKHTRMALGLESDFNFKTIKQSDKTTI